MHKFESLEGMTNPCCCILKKFPEYRRLRGAGKGKE
jgi:hypothetical protein